MSNIGIVVVGFGGLHLIGTIGTWLRVPESSMSGGALVILNVRLIIGLALVIVGLNL